MSDMTSQQNLMSGYNSAIISYLFVYLSISHTFKLQPVAVVMHSKATVNSEGRREEGGEGNLHTYIHLHPHTHTHTHTYAHTNTNTHNYTYVEG